MRNQRMIVLSLAVCVFAALQLTGCPAPLKKGFEPASNIPEGKALVYVYRLGKGYATGLKYYVLEANGVKVARMYAGGYFPYYCNPGRTEFTSRGDKTARVVLDIEAGRTYYLKLYQAEGIEVDTPALEIVSPETGLAELGTCKLIDEKKETGF